MEIYQKILELEKNNRPFVIATVVEMHGSVPGKVGFKMVVESDGTSTGTVGGGAIEQQVTKESLQRLSTGRSGLQEYLLTNKPVDEQSEVPVVPMMCNGKVWIYYEVHGQRPTVYVFGGGHVGQALLYHLAPLGYHTVLIDNREEFATTEKNPHASERIFMDYVEYARQFNPPPDAYVAILTQGHRYDYDILKTFYERKLTFSYIGIIASKSKAAGLIRNLKEDFGEDVDLSRIRTPIGLDIGGSSAAEIALSIAAEIQAVRYGKRLPAMADPASKKS